MRLIDADATIIGLDTALACSRVVAGKDAIQNKALDIFENAKVFVANMPTIDAVPVVRCKDCALQGKLNCPMDEWVKTDGNGFCHHGKRKDDDG